MMSVLNRSRGFVLGNTNKQTKRPLYTYTYLNTLVYGLYTYLNILVYGLYTYLNILVYGLYTYLNILVYGLSRCTFLTVKIVSCVTESFIWKIWPRQTWRIDPLRITPRSCFRSPPVQSTWMFTWSLIQEWSGRVFWDTTCRHCANGQHELTFLITNT